MNKRYRLIIFDWEGTLADTLGLILHCIASEAKRLQIGNLDEAEARQMVEFGLVNALKKMFPHLYLEQQERLLSAVQQALLTKHNEVFLIPGALDLVKELKQEGFLLAIASNKGSQSLERAIENTGLTAYFDCICSASQFKAKPDVEMLLYILETLSVSPTEAVMVGDSVTDVQMAVNAFVDAFGIDLYQHQTKLLETAGALKIFNNYQDLSHYLLQHQEEISS